MKISKRYTCLQTSSATAMISCLLGRVARPYLSPNFHTNLVHRTRASDSSSSQLLGLRYGLATRPNQLEIMAVAEDVWIF